MRKVFSLLLALLLMLCITAPIALATATFVDPPEQSETVSAEPASVEHRLIIPYSPGADPPTAAVDLTPLLQAVISLCASLITAFLIPWIKAKYSAEKRQRIAAVYQTLVYAAEQLFGTGAGDKKLKWVIDQLYAKGFAVDRAAIEAEVAKMQNLGTLLVNAETAANDT